MDEKGLEKQNRNIRIDVAKGLAMIMVILVHSTQKITELSRLFDVFKVGQLGCQLFFLMSGYLLMMSQDKHHRSVKSFYLSRFAEIAPGYYLMIILGVVLNALTNRFLHRSIGWAENRSIYAIIANFLFLHGIVPNGNNDVVAGGWYIGTLMAIYAVFPVIYQIMKKSKHYRYIPFLGMVFSLGYAVLMYTSCHYDVFDNNGFYYYSIIEQMPCFLLGCSLYLTYQFHNREIKKKTYLLGCILILLSFLSYHLGNDIHSICFLIMPYLFSTGCYFVLEYKLNSKKDSFNSFEKILAKFGENSFFIYLAHPFFVWLLPRIVRKIINYFEFPYYPTLFYVLLLPGMIFFSYLFGAVLKKLCKPVSKWILKNVQKSLFY